MSNNTSESGFGQLKSGLWGCVLVTFAMAAAYPLFAWYGYYRFGDAGLYSSAVAGSVCWLGGVVGLAVASQFTGRLAASGALLAMLIRMIPPLVVGVVVLSQQLSLVKAGLLEMMIVYYLFGLAIETTWLVRQVSRSQGSLKAP